ncbi:unnamed protein product [Lactuca saligna]|uniref:Uncharacterized protein n=1 Tax=Lactuca saligna TaxID=75948 RepID=A0AA35VBC9_LACSI|nr:unnamed protein product [Lactuca saligna]
MNWDSLRKQAMSIDTSSSCLPCGHKCWEDSSETGTVQVDQLTLYELHYQMITFGKCFCKCKACPTRNVNRLLKIKQHLSQKPQNYWAKIGDFRITKGHASSPGGTCCGNSCATTHGSSGFSCRYHIKWCLCWDSSTRRGWIMKKRMQDLDDRILKQQQEEEEKKRQRRERKKEQKKEKAVEEEIEVDPDVAAMMGFGDKLHTQLLDLVQSEIRPAPNMDTLVKIYKSMEVSSRVNILITQTEPQNSGKMGLLDKLLPKLKERDSRVLIFSQESTSGFVSSGSYS